VVIGDDVEIGANCAIDRGRFEATRIGNGVKLDNLVHLARSLYELGAAGQSPSDAEFDQHA
jgi:UDP-3-O-[3-hydroxymyristoyl] glucosamine N-acyltransferase